MPEIAEVETVRRQLDRHLRGQIIRAVDLDKKDHILFQFAKPALVTRALLGARITGTGRKGKYFWFELDRRPWPLFHLGMSGGASIFDPKKAAVPVPIWEGVKLWSANDADIKDRLWFCKLVLTTDKGIEFGFRDPRRFGRMWLTDDPSEHPRVRDLGFDPLQKFPPAKVLGENLIRRRQAIKTVLLDQTLFAGIGNYLADEILFQARLAPHRLANQLDPSEVARLRKFVVEIVKKAAALNADYERFPKTWLFHHRWGKNKLAKTSRGLKIEHVTIGGRTTAWVPAWQH